MREGRNFEERSKKDQTNNKSKQQCTMYSCIIEYGSTLHIGIWSFSITPVQTEFQFSLFDNLTSTNIKVGTVLKAN